MAAIHLMEMAISDPGCTSVQAWRMACMGVGYSEWPEPGMYQGVRLGVR